MKSLSVILLVPLKHNPRELMKTSVLQTTKGESNVNSLAIGHDYSASRPFDFKELQGWVLKMINQKDKQREIIEQIEYRSRKVTAPSANELLKQRILKVAENNIMNSDFSVNEFAREVGMSTAQLYRKLTALTGYAPNDFMRQIRLQRAVDLLIQKAGNVSEIGYKVGFNNLSYFSKCFKEKYGELPSSYLGSVVAI